MRPDYAVVTARSPRAVVLFGGGPQTAGLGSALNRVLEWFGRVWGGAQMLCVPAPENGPVAPVFRRLARAYDPDVVLLWHPTLGALALDDLTAARTLVDGWREQHPSGQNAQLDALVDDSSLRRSAIMIGAAPSSTALHSLLDSTATFQVPLGAPQPTTWHLQVDLPAPLTALSALAEEPGYTWPARPFPAATEAEAARQRLGLPLTELDLTGLDPWLQTLMKVRLGVVGLPEDGETEGMRPSGEMVSHYRLNPQTDSAAAVCVGLAGRPHQAPLDWSQQITLDHTPLRRSGTGLLELSYGRPTRGSYLLVVGDSPEDCCLYLSWLRTYGEGSATWLPAAAAEPTESSGDHVEFAKAFVRDLLADPLASIFTRGWITSCSLDPQELRRLRDDLSAQHWSRDVSARFAGMPLVAPEQIEIDEPPSVYTATADVFDQAIPVLIQDDGSAGAIVRSPVPALLVRHATAGAGGLLANWVSDATVASCRLPRRRTAAAAAERDQSVLDAGLVRVGRTGTAWIAVQRRDVPPEVLVDHALTRLSLRDPDMSVLIRALLPADWSWQPSDAGRFYQGFAEMTGGLDGLVAALRERSTRLVLEAFRPRLEDQSGLRLKDGRRYLRLSDCRHAINKRSRLTGEAATDIPALRLVLDRLLAQGILSRGLVLKCSRCRYTSFQPIGSVDGQFTCTRCLLRQPLDSAAWCNTPPHEPAWFYRLDELVYQALAHNVDVPALALAELGAQGKSARYSWSIELTQQGQRQLELDFVCLVEGRLFTGEAKSNGTSGSARKASDDVSKTVRGARLLQADEVVFATTAPRWDTAAKEAVVSQTDGLDPPYARVLTNVS